MPRSARWEQTTAAATVSEVIRFADCELNLDRVVLRRGGEEIRVEPQVFDVLAYLVKHRGAVVRKEELLDAIWGDRFVSESALTTRIKAVRQAVGDDGSQQLIIRTVHGKGYEFVATVEEIEEGRTGVAMSPVATGASIGVRVQPLIGREMLLEQLAEMIVDHRLVTLIGPGGVGKTSLAMELARTVGGQFEDGVHVVELVGVVDQDATAAALATAIDVNLRKSSSIDDAIIDLLRPRHSLLVLDNCEHLIEPVAELVARILREAPTIAIVATSREPLAVAGERLWTVDPLPTGPEDLFASDVALGELAEIPAVALFVARAKAADPSFALDEVIGPLVVEICRRLDGIPLAIELAAARARAIGVAEVAHRLDQRFGVLKAMRRGSDPRHRTMHDAISWSYDMLEPDERALFTALSVFAGSFELRSAEAMAPGGDTLDLLTRLTERSMLAVRPQAGGSTRYELLETLREYGRTRLSDARAAELFAAHARHFAAEAGRVEAELCGPGEGDAIARAESSLADLRAAQRFALELGALDVTFGLITSIREFAMRAMRYEVFAWADAACNAPGALDHPLAPMLTGIRAYGAWVRGEFDLAVQLAEETRQLERRLSVFPSGLAERTFANVLYLVGEPMKGHAEALRQIELAEESGNRSRTRPRLLSGGGGTQLERCLRRGRGPHCTSQRRGEGDDVTDGPGLGRGRPRVCQPNRGRGSGGVHRERPDRRCRRKPLDARVRRHRGERTPGLSRRARGRVCGSRRYGRSLGPRRGLVTAVAYPVPLCDRPRSDRPSRTRHRAVRCHREARHARRGADVEHPA